MSRHQRKRPHAHRAKKTRVNGRVVKRNASRRGKA